MVFELFKYFLFFLKGMILVFLIQIQIPNRIIFSYSFTSLPSAGPPKMKPAAPPPPAKITSSHKPPMAPRVTENRYYNRREGSDKEIMIQNGNKIKLKPLHWDKVIANADHSMVWNEINDGSFR